MIKILGIIDIASAVVFLLAFYQVDLPFGIFAFFAVYLILKGIIFLADIGSLMDVGAGAVLLLGIMSISIPGPFLILFAAFLGIKGLASLFA